MEQLFEDAAKNQAITLPDQERRVHAIEAELKVLHGEAGNLLRSLETLPSGYSGEAIHQRLKEKEQRQQIRQCRKAASLLKMSTEPRG